MAILSTEMMSKRTRLTSLAKSTRQCSSLSIVLAWVVKLDKSTSIFLRLSGEINVDLTNAKYLQSKNIENIHTHTHTCTPTHVLQFKVSSNITVLTTATPYLIHWQHFYCQSKAPNANQTNTYVEAVRTLRGSLRGLCFFSFGPQ